MYIEKHHSGVCTCMVRLLFMNYSLFEIYVHAIHMYKNDIVYFPAGTICHYVTFFNSIFFFSIIGQSGGVDEEFFTKSFEDVPKVQVSLPFWERWERK